ncbi:MAG: hypothetical protein KatS3mg082_1812 [Nitrospiraceae bacterium]|nr:MAG: hypothetical protein KatS3mg082_1812 [Nitrospiraceae bacterium]
MYGLRMPEILDHPEGQLDLSGWKEVWRCERYESAEQMVSLGWWPAAVVQRDVAAYEGSHAKIVLRAGTNTASSFRKRAVFAPEHYANGTNPAPTEILVRFRLRFGEDVGDVDGVKLPGAHGMFENGPFPAGMANLSSYGFSLRTEHTPRDPKNPRWLGHFTYSYVPGQAGSGSGTPWYTGQDRHFCVRVGSEYEFAQHVRLNSFAPDGTPNADAIYRLYVNGMLLCERNGIVLRADPRVTSRGLAVGEYLPRRPHAGDPRCHLLARTGDGVRAGAGFSIRARAPTRAGARTYTRTRTAA